jgi:hypothetical protein
LGCGILMKYIFYGRNEAVDYNPMICDYYGAKVPTLGKWNRFISNEEFLVRENIHVEIKAGQRINIDGESVYVRDVQYNVINDVYRVYTEKILSRVTGNMTEKEAQTELDNKVKNRNVFQKLWDWMG